MDVACPQFNAVESRADLSVDDVGLSSTDGLSRSGGGTLAVGGLSVGLSGFSVCGLSGLSVCGLLMSGGLSGLSGTLLFAVAGLSGGLSGLSVCGLSGTLALVAPGLSVGLSGFSVCGLSGLSVCGLLVSAGIEGRLSYALVTYVLSDAALVLLCGLSVTVCGLSGGATLGLCSTNGLASPGLTATPLPPVPTPVPTPALAGAPAPLGVTADCLLAMGGGAGFFDGVSLHVLHTLT